MLYQGFSYNQLLTILDAMGLSGLSARLRPEIVIMHLNLLQFGRPINYQR